MKREDEFQIFSRCGCNPLVAVLGTEEGCLRAWKQRNIWGFNCKYAGKCLSKRRNQAPPCSMCILACGQSVFRFCQTVKLLLETPRKSNAECNIPVRVEYLLAVTFCMQFGDQCLLNTSFAHLLHYGMFHDHARSSSKGLTTLPPLSFTLTCLEAAHNK